MPFTAKWITAAGTIAFDGNPYKIEGGFGIGGAEVRNLFERGPQQDGVSDLGYRIDPRTATFAINFAGTSPAHLDTLRSTLQYHFSPRQGLGTLQITRDDGEVREIYARRTGPLDMPLVATHKPGNLHKTAVQLFAPDPVWTEPGAGSASFLAPSDWWLAFNTIGSANVLEHVESPTQGQAWSYAGTVTAGSPWFVAIRSGRETYDGTINAAFMVDHPSALDIRFIVQDGGGTVSEYAFAAPNGNVIGTSIMAAGTHNYFFVDDGTDQKVYRDASLIATGEFNGGGALSGTPRRWRSNSANEATSYWSNALPRAAVYNISPTPAQLAALNQSMQSGGSVYSVPLVYQGDLPEYPTVKITGPISDPVLTNTTTGEKLDFTGVTIGSADFYTITLGYGNKRVRNSGGDNKISQLSDDSDLASFHIEPAPNAAGGTNIFSLAGTATTGNTSAVITYYNRFESW